VAIELKLGSFDPSHKGQMELYLRWLERYERRPGEEPPIGLILCGEKNREQIDLLQLGRGEIRVRSAWWGCSPREMLGPSWDIDCSNPSSGIRSSRMSKSSIKTFLSQKYHY